MIEYAWIFKLLRDVAFTWWYFGEFCYLNTSWIRKMFMSFSRNKLTLLYQNSVTDVFVGFRPPCWCPSRWAPAWRLSIQISRNLGKTFLQITRIQNILVTWILARGFVYLPPFISQIPDFIYWTVLIFILIHFNGVTLKTSNTILLLLLLFIYLFIFIYNILMLLM